MLELQRFKAAAVQAAPVFLDTDATVDKVVALIAEAAGHGYVDKAVASPAKQHQVGHDGGVLRISRAEVEVEEAVSVEVAEVRAHRQHREVQSGCGRGIGEGALAIASVEPRRLVFSWFSKQVPRLVLGLAIDIQHGNIPALGQKLFCCGQTNPTCGSGNYSNFNHLAPSFFRTFGDASRPYK